MNDYQVRVVNETAELQEKLDKLGAFVVSQSFLELEKIDQRLLTRQITSMKTYRNVLLERIERFGGLKNL